MLSDRVGIRLQNAGGLTTTGGSQYLTRPQWPLIFLGPAMVIAYVASLSRSCSASVRVQSPSQSCVSTASKLHPQHSNLKASLIMMPINPINLPKPLLSKLPQQSRHKSRVLISLLLNLTLTKRIQLSKKPHFLHLPNKSLDFFCAADLYAIISQYASSSSVTQQIKPRKERPKT